MTAQVYINAIQDELSKIAASELAGPKRAKEKDANFGPGPATPDLPGAARGGSAVTISSAMGSKMAGALSQLARHFHHYEDPYELAGLGILGGIGADRIQAHLRAGSGASEKDIEKKQLLGETGHAVADTAGLGVLALPTVSKMLLKK